jgi:hypothetical protein
VAEPIPRVSDSAGLGPDGKTIFTSSQVMLVVWGHSFMNHSSKQNRPESTQDWGRVFITWEHFRQL